MLTRSGAFIAGAAVKTVPHVGGGGLEKERVFPRYTSRSTS